MAKRESIKDDITFDVAEEAYTVNTNSGPVRIARMHTETRISNPADLEVFLSSPYQKRTVLSGDSSKIVERTKKAIGQGKAVTLPHMGEFYTVEVPVTGSPESLAEAMEYPAVRKFATVAKSTMRRDAVFDDQNNLVGVRLGFIPNDIGPRPLDPNQKAHLSELKIKDATLKDIATMVISAGSRPDLPPVQGGGKDR